jgi:hypothetical protein
MATDRPRAETDTESPGTETVVCVVFHEAREPKRRSRLRASAAAAAFAESRLVQRDTINIRLLRPLSRKMYLSPRYD